MLKLIAIFFSVIVLFNCKKTKSCEYDSCSPNRRTIYKAVNWSGPIGYYNDLRKWAANVSIPNTIDGIRTCIFCTDIPDSLKQLGKIVTFSGDLKENCENVQPNFFGQEIYFVTPTVIK